MPASQPPRPGSLGARAAAALDFFTRDVWSRELTTLPTFRRWAYRTARVTYLAGTNFVKDRCTWRASALTYITVLSLVPMLAFAFSVAKGLGVYQSLREDTIEDFLDTTFGSAELAEEAPVEVVDGGEGEAIAEGSGETPVPPPAPGVEPDSGDEAPSSVAADDGEPGSEVGAEGGAEVRQALDTVLDFVQDTDVASLGVLGLVIVIWTVLQLLGSIERSFNDIWGVRRSRSLARKLSDYLSTLVLVPLVLVTATGVVNLKSSTAAMDWLGLDSPGRGVSFLLVLPVIASGFAFSYVVMPNTRVRLPSALLGGLVGGALWQVFQIAHLELQVGVANYNAIYSTFAALPIFLFWLYASWVTVLLGAEVAAAHQNEASHRQMVRARDYGQTLKETIALRLAVRLARAFGAGERPPSSEEVAEELSVPDRTLDEVVEALAADGLVAVADGDGDVDALVLTRAPERVRIQDVYDALKGGDARADLVASGPLDAALDRVMRDYDEARRATGENRTLAELAALESTSRAEAEGGPAPAPAADA